MNFEGSKEVKSGVGKVWKFMTAPENMVQCMPDVQSYNVVDSKTVQAKLKVGIGFIKEIFDSVITFAEVEADKKLLITVNSKAKANSATIKIEVSIDGDDTKSTLKWNVDAIMAGRLASIGQRYIQKVSDKIVEQSFVCMTQKLLL